jgi:FixJ family two-component response regulator
MMRVVTGLLNKQIAGELGISEVTVKAHRGQVMRKMNVRSLAELINKAGRLALAGAPRDAESAACSTRVEA